MLDLVRNWVDLFRRGKLFADTRHFYQQLSLGILVAVVLFVVTALATGTIWFSALVGGGVGGAVQPYFFKNLRYR